MKLYLCTYAPLSIKIRATSPHQAQLLAKHFWQCHNAFDETTIDVVLIERNNIHIRKELFI